MIRDENGRLSGYVYVDVSGRDIGSYVTDAKKVVAEKVSVPAGYQLVWSGQYESMERVKERLKIVVPITLFHRVPVALLEYQVHGENFHHPPLRYRFGDWRDLVPLSTQLQHEYRGMVGSSRYSEWMPRRLSSCCCTGS